MSNNNYKLAIRSSLSGDVIEEVPTLQEAWDTITKYELEDKADGNYTDNFYEVYDLERNYIITA